MTEKYGVKSEQAQALKDLEKFVGKTIPQVEEINLKTFGVKVKDKNVIGLGLYEQILSILPESISNLSSLRILRLGSDKLTTLPESISNLKSLQRLDLGWNKLTTLPESITNLKSLTELDLGGNKLTILPESISNLSSLTNLNLRYNKLTTLPDSIGNLSSLEKLNLNENHLTTLPESISNLKLLKRLDLIFNKLPTLPDSIGNLKSLQRLDLRWNELTTLPDSIGALSSLKELDLRTNKLRTLPDSIGNLSSLEKLFLSENHLTALPESIGNLKSLKNLYLRDNKWKGEWKDMESLRAVPKIFEFCRKLHGVVIFVSHAMVNQKQYRVIDLKNILVKGDIVHDVYICEQSTGQIWAFMAENIPKSHLLLFIGTKESLLSDDCQYELALARKYGVRILPLKGADIKWKDLEKIDLRTYGQGVIDLSKSEGFEFDGKNFDEICARLHEYIKVHETELKLLKKESKELDDLLYDTNKSVIDFIDSKQFREHLKANFDELKESFEEVSNNQITSMDYYWKLGQILTKRKEN